MSVAPEFLRLMRPLFATEEDLEIVQRWDVPFSEVARIVSAGKLPEVSITFPLPEVYAYATQPWESIYLAALRYEDATLMMRPYENRAVYELLLVRRRK